LWLSTPTARESSTGRSEKLKKGRTPTPTEYVALFPTPTKFDATCGDLEGKEYNGKTRHAMKLIQAAKLWPTPTAMDSKGLDTHLRRDCTSTRSVLLSQKVKMFPTPTARNGTGPSETETRQGGKDLQTEVGGLLNPEWVEWLMGFPTGWTDLPASETQ